MSKKHFHPILYNRVIKDIITRMSHIPQDLFNQLLPRAAAWAAEQERYVLEHKDRLPLTVQEKEIARRAGVQCPDHVRLLAVYEIPLPEEPDLRQAADTIQLITPSTAGLTIGYGIFVRQDCLQDAKLVAHELKHVAQYERHGSILAFLQQYLAECNEHGYPMAPMEQEAVAFAEKEFPTA